METKSNEITNAIKAVYGGSLFSGFLFRAPSAFS